MNQEPFAQAVCYFLAEQLRVRRIDLKRAAEISQKVLQNINLVSNEADFLRFIKELSNDFEELQTLEKIVFMNMRAGSRKQMDNAIKEFVVATIVYDLPLATQVLSEAIKVEARAEDLLSKYPQLGKYLRKEPNEHTIRKF